MRKQILTLTCLLTFALLPGLAVQAQPIMLGGNADCEGWSANATLTFPDDVFSSTLDYTVILTDQEGAEVTQFDWAGMVQRWEEPVMNIMYGQPWDMTLDSVYSASIVFHFLGEEAAMNFEVVCGVIMEPDPEPEVEPCHFTFRYWRNHPEEWPVGELQVGDTVLSKNELLRLLNRRLRFHPAISVARHLVAAKLNVANGTDDSIVPTIEAADAFLVDHAQSWRHWWRNRCEARALRRELVRYNKQSCDQFKFDGTQDDEQQLEKTFADEPMSLDGLKAMYR